MTCLEKLRELHPEKSEEWIGLCVKNRCPSLYMEIENPRHCPAIGRYDGGRVDLVCGACWVRDYVDPIPHEFEYISRMAIEVEDEVQYVEFWKHYVEILDRRVNKYTGKLCYKIIDSCDQGYIDEDWYTEDEIRKMLEARVENDG